MFLKLSHGVEKEKDQIDGVKEGRRGRMWFAVELCDENHAAIASAPLHPPRDSSQGRKTFMQLNRFEVSYKAINMISFNCFVSILIP